MGSISSFAVLKHRDGRWSRNGSSVTKRFVTKWSAACPLPCAEGGCRAQITEASPGASRVAPAQASHGAHPHGSANRGHDPRGPLTEANRLNLYRAETGEPLVTRSVRGSTFKAPIQALARRSGCHPGSMFIVPIQALAQITEANPPFFYVVWSTGSAY